MQIKHSGFRIEKQIRKFFSRIKSFMPRGSQRRVVIMIAAAFFTVIGLSQLATAQVPADTLFISSAIETVTGSVSLPLYTGTSQGRVVYYVITEASDRNLATQLGVNYAPRLRNAANTAAVQRVSTNSAPFSYNFPASVNFAPVRQVVAGANGFPPSVAIPGALGETGYSPLIQLPDGIVLNAPQIANATGQADRVISLNVASNRVTIDEADGFQGNQPVRYLVFDASDATSAALEAATYAPALLNLPRTDSSSSSNGGVETGSNPSGATANLALMRDGQRGRNNVQRQGINSALFGEGDPLNILEVNPTSPDYSPMWDVRHHQWKPEIAVTSRFRQQDYNVVEDLEESGQFLEPNDVPSYIVVNCPIVARRSDAVPPSFTPVLSSVTVNYLAQIRVTNGQGGVAPGVLVTFDDGSTCLTSSQGGCTYPLVEGNFLTVTHLNRVSSAPGLPVTVFRPLCQPNPRTGRCIVP